MARAPFGSDSLEVPAFLATGEDDPALAAWKRDHPDWFVAGTWTATTPARSDSPPQTPPENEQAQGTLADEPPHSAPVGTAPPQPGDSAPTESEPDRNAPDA